MKHLLFGLLALALLGAVYYAFTQSGYLENGIRTAEDVQARTNELEQSILADFDRINAIRLDRTVFDHPTYRALVDTQLVIAARPISRDDPFAQY